MVPGDPGPPADHTTTRRTTRGRRCAAAEDQQCARALLRACRQDPGMRLPVTGGSARCWRRQRSRRPDAPAGNAAPVRQGMTSGELAPSPRQINAQRGKGKHPPDVAFRPEPFPHYRNGPGRTCAWCRSGGDFKPVTASAPKQRDVLLEQVKARVTAELASRQRKRERERKDGQNQAGLCAGARRQRSLSVTRFRRRLRPRLAEFAPAESLRGAHGERPASPRRSTLSGSCECESVIRDRKAVVVICGGNKNRQHGRRGGARASIRRIR